jgi:hypothetical protein
MAENRRRAEARVGCEQREREREREGNARVQTTDAAPAAAAIDGEDHGGGDNLTGDKRVAGGRARTQSEATGAGAYARREETKTRADNNA